MHDALNNFRLSFILQEVRSCFLSPTQLPLRLGKSIGKAQSRFSVLEGPSPTSGRYREAPAVPPACEELVWFLTPVPSGASPVAAKVGVLGAYMCLFPVML